MAIYASDSEISLSSGDELLGEDIRSESLGALNKKVAKSDSHSDHAWMRHQCQIASARKNSVDKEKLAQPRALYRYYTGDRSKLTVFDRQTFLRWKSMMEMERVRHPRRQRRRTILIQPIYWRSDVGEEKGTRSGEDEVSYGCTFISDQVLDYLQKFCAAFYLGMEVKVCPALDLHDIPNVTSRVHSSTNRRQFLVDDIISYLKKSVLSHCYCVLGVTVVDLYPGPEWNFVLGQASFENGCGVLSFGRYFNACSLPLLEGDEVVTLPIHRTSSCEMLEAKQMRNIYVLLRGLSHELGHLLGLAHCYYFQCAMNESSSISEAASQPLFLCPVCLAKVKKMLKYDLSLRYQAMLEVVQTIRLVVSEISQDELTANTGANTSIATSDRPDLPPIESQENTSRTLLTATVSGEKQLLLLEESIGWLERALSDLGEFTQLGQTKSDVVKGRQDLPHRGTGSLLCC